MKIIENHWKQLDIIANYCVLMEIIIDKHRKGAEGAEKQKVGAEGAGNWKIGAEGADGVAHSIKSWAIFGNDWGLSGII